MEIPIRRNGQRSKARSSRCLRRVRLEFGDVPTAATRTGAKCMRHIDGLQDAIRTKNGWLPGPSSASSGVPPQIIDRIVILITAFLLAQMSE
jgi:hypothetical protein